MARRSPELDEVFRSDLSSTGFDHQGPHRVTPPSAPSLRRHKRSISVRPLQPRGHISSVHPSRRQRDGHFPGARAGRERQGRRLGGGHHPIGDASPGRWVSFGVNICCQTLREEIGVHGDSELPAVGRYVGEAQATRLVGAVSVATESASVKATGTPSNVRPRKTPNNT